MSVLTENLPVTSMAEPYLGHASRQNSRQSSSLRSLPQRTPGSWPIQTSQYSISTSSLGSIDSSSSVNGPSQKAAPRPRPAQIPESPPTPPVSNAVSNGQVSNSARSSLKTPPTIQKSPPTPEDTPPRKKTLQPPLNHALSTTDSFTTAREDQWSTDEDAPLKPVKSAGKQAEEWWGANQSSRLKHIGLGLGLESDDSDTTSTPPGNKRHKSENNELISLDGNWGQDLHNVKQMDQVFSMNRKEHLPRIKTTTRMTRELPIQRLDSGFETASLKRSTLRERIEQQHISDDDSTNQFGEGFQWPVSQEETSSREGLSDDPKRYSQASNASTIIREALVMDLTPQKQPVLRHTGRNLAFRNTQVDMLRADRQGKSESEASHKLVHHSKKITNQDRHSIASEVSATDFRARRLSQTSQSSQAEIIPVVIIPKRQSSLKKRADFGKQYSQSLTSGSISSRPVTSDRQGYFDVPRKRRTISNGSSTLKKTPIVPPRSSSLSAPTSRIGSRAGSMTSASMHSQSENKENERDPSHTQAIETNHELLTVHFNLHSPFSNPSSTPEALEVSQARAINFYPHTNHSVNLVVQSNSHSGTSGTDQPFFTPNESTAVQIEQVETPRIAKFGPSTSQLSMQALNQVDSPLRNPRKPPDPPQPPHLMVIPPTPANGNTPSNEHVEPQIESVPKGPVSKVRRAFSQRSSSVSSSLNRFKSNSSSRDHSRRPSRSFSLIRRPSRVTEKKEAKLHPFWRPRGFWEGFENEEEARYVVGEDFLDRGWTPWLDNSVNAANQRFSYMEPEVTLALNENGMLRKVKWLRRISTGSQIRPYSPKSEATGMSWSSMQQRLKQAQLQRKERAMERKRQKLRKVISGPMLMNSSNPAF